MNTAWYRMQRWQIASFLAVAAALNYADRAAFSSVLPALRSELHLSDVELGVLGSLFLWCYALGSTVAGMMADRWSRSLLVCLSLALWSGVTLLTGFVSSFMIFALLRCALGLSESLYLPAATALLADHHPPATRGRAMSLHSVGLNFGVVLGGTFAGYLAENFGWRVGFWVLGGAGVLLALASWNFIGNSSIRAPAIKRADFATACRYLVRVPSFYALIVKGVLAGIGIWIFLSWLPLYFRDQFNLTLGASGFAGTFMLQISTVLGIAAGGWISDRVAARNAQRRMLVQALSYLVAAPFLLLFLFEPGFALVAFAVSVFSLFRGLGQANENPTLCEIVPVQFRSTAIGIMNTCATAAGGVGVITVGWLKGDFGLNAIFAGISVMFFLAGGLLLVAYYYCSKIDIQRARAAELS